MIESLAKRLGATALVVAFVVCAGCGGKKDKSETKQQAKAKKTPGPPKPVAPPPWPKGPTSFPDLKVTVDGKALPIHSAYAFWVGPEVVKLELSSVKRGCPRNPTMRSVAPGEKFFKVWLGRRLDPSGKLGWGILQSYFGGRTRRDTRVGMVSVVSEPEKGAHDRIVGGRVKGTLELDHLGDARRKRKAQRLHVSGRFNAIVCPLPDPLARYQPRDGSMKMSLAGHDFHVVGASVTRHGDMTQVVLSPEMRDCRRAAVFTRAMLTLILQKGKLRRALLRGSWFGTPLRKDYKGAAPLAVKLAHANDGHELVTINGKLELGGYPIKLSGRVQALGCTKTKPAKKPKSPANKGHKPKKK